MSGKLSQIGDNYALQIVTGQSAGPGARTTYVALCTGSVPADNATTPTALANEIATSGYARQAVTWGAPTGDAPAQISNSGTVTYGPFNVNQATPITVAVLVSSASGTGGDFLAYWLLDAAVSPAAGQSVQFAIGALILTNN